MPHALSTQSSFVFPTIPCLHIMNNNPWSLQLRSTVAVLQGRNCLLRFREKETGVEQPLLGPYSCPPSCPYHLSDFQQLHLHFFAQWLPFAVGLASLKCWSNDHTLPNSFQPLTDGSLCRNTLFPLTCGDSPKAMGSTLSPKNPCGLSVPSNLYDKWGDSHPLPQMGRSTIPGSLSSFIAKLIIPQVCHNSTK